MIGLFIPISQIPEKTQNCDNCKIWDYVQILLYILSVCDPTNLSQPPHPPTHSPTHPHTHPDTIHIHRNTLIYLTHKNVYSLEHWILKQGNYIPNKYKNDSPCNGKSCWIEVYYCWASFWMNIFLEVTCS